MSKVLFFFNCHPVKAVEIEAGKNTVECEYLNGEKTNLNIMYAGVRSLTGVNLAIRVAINRAVTSEEILKAAEKFL
ncbi:hypothetical protein DFO55_11512 [Grimontella sp. AG753]|nr:hypothetical protein DFO55_11512 [Grimontella sp. AG753]